MAQDGDARYLAFEVLSGTISPAADVFSLGLAALELVSDYDMPINGDLWTSIRQLELPVEILSVLTDENLKELLLQMIHTDHKQRPTAKEILESSTIKNEVKKKSRRTFVLIRFDSFRFVTSHRPSLFTNRFFSSSSFLSFCFFSI